MMHEKETPSISETIDAVEADSRLIHWLLHESGVSRYYISREIGISESTLSRIASGETPINAVRFGFAHKLTDYARLLQKNQSQKKGEANT